MPTRLLYLFTSFPGTIIDGLVLTGHGHLTERKTLAFFDDSMIPCRHSGEKPRLRSMEMTVGNTLDLVVWQGSRKGSTVTLSARVFNRAIGDMRSERYKQLESAKCN